MSKVEIPYVQSMKCGHGHARHYFRRRGFKRVTLPGAPGSPEFAEAYEAAMSGETAPARQPGAERIKPGSVAALIVAFYQSSEWKAYQPNTQKGHRNALDRFREAHGDKPVLRMEPHHIRSILDKMADKPGAADNLRKRLRTLMAWAVERNWRKDNPMLAIRRPRGRRGEGFIPWSDDDIEAFEKKWPSGSRERRALALLLYTGQRRSDVVTMGRQYVRGDKIRVKQLKTEVRLAIPIHSKLKIELDAAPSGDLAFVTTQYGLPFSAAGFTQWFVERAEEAGLSQRSPHGLRKAAARRMAEAGCTTKQIAAITGHTTLKEVENYTRSSDQERLADQAMEKLEGARENGSGP